MLKQMLKQSEFEVNNDKTREAAKEIDFNGDLEQLRAGLEIEQEHGPNGPEDGKYDVTDGEPSATAEIAAAHISEIPDYYDRLQAMEDNAKKASIVECLHRDVQKLASKKLSRLVSKM